LAAFDRYAVAVTGAVQQIDVAVWRIVAPNPSPLTGPGTNSYVVGAERPVVIDPGCDDRGHLERILEVTGGVIERILCTHSHTDHSPGSGWLRERTGAGIYGLPPPDDGHQDPAYAPDASLADGERIATSAGTLVAIHTPGHASNHVCFLLESQRLLFTGDHLMHGSTVVIIPPDGSMRLYLDSLRRLRPMSIDSLAPGHGDVIEPAHAEIDRVVAHRLEREAKLVRALSARSSATLEEVLAEVYADVPVSMHPYARYSLLAHAVKLVEDGRVRLDGDRYRWIGD
jgi:glyoxylase-like metal-dependent hydrolase (beta-lactamase superfamily II)